MKNLIAQANFGGGIQIQDAQGGLAKTVKDVTEAGTNDAVLTGTELFISQIIGFMTMLGALVFVFMFLWGGLQWISAGGDSSRIEKARNTMIQGVIGLIIMIAAYAVMGLIGTVIGINILSPAESVGRIFNL